MASQMDYNLLLVNVADQLRPEDIEKIVFTQGLPPDYENKSKLKTLLGLQMEGKIGEDKLRALDQVLNDVKRTDLAKVVKDFAKTQRKKPKKNPKPEGEKTHEEYFKANMKRAMLLAELLQDHICCLLDHAKTVDAQEVLQDSRDKAEILKEKLKLAKNLNNIQSEESSDSDSTPSPPNTLNRQHLQRELQAAIATRPQAMTPNTGGQTMVKKPIPAAENPEENVYEEVSALKIEGSSSSNVSPSPKPRYENSAVIARSSLLVTGRDKSPVAGRRPSPLPKPLPKPRTFSKQSKEFDTDDYTGTSTSTTGDSGFSDVKPFLKTALNEESSSLETLESVTPTTTFSPAHSTADGYYKTLLKEDIKASYYMSVRDNRYQDMMKDADTTESLSEGERERGEERVYENLRQSPHLRQSRQSPQLRQSPPRR